MRKFVKNNKIMDVIHIEDEVIFISSPYSHESKLVQTQRYLKVLGYCAKLMNEGKFVFSPIVHCHDLAEKHTLPTDWKYWGGYCEVMLKRCTRMYVLMIDGWEESVGIKGEIALANKFNIPVEYIEFEK